MPNCFQLFRKGEKIAVPLNEVDRELCVLLNEEEHPKYYVANWFDTIGFTIACCNDCDLGTQKLRDKIKEIFGNSSNYVNIEKCLTYLEEHYSSTAWVEIGKR